MRIVTFLLLKEQLKRTLIAVIFLLFIGLLIQFVLQEKWRLDVAIRRSISLGTVVGGAWTTVRWRYFGGNILLENRGVPFWLTGITVGVFSAVIMFAGLSMTRGKVTIQAMDGKISWQSQSGEHTLSREHLLSAEQHKLFIKIYSTIERQPRGSFRVFLVTCFPFILSLVLLRVGRHDDLWSPILFTGIALITMEFWVQSLG